MHGMNPPRFQLHQSLHHSEYWLRRGKDASFAITLAHLLAQIFLHNGWLVTRLNTQIRRKQAVCCFVNDHQRIPMVNMWRFPETQSMCPKIEYIPVLNALDGTGIIPFRQVDRRTHQATDQHRLPRFCDEATHATAFVGLEVRDDDVVETRRIEDLGHGLTDGLIERTGSCVDEGRMLVLNEKLIEAHV